MCCGTARLLHKVAREAIDRVHDGKQKAGQAKAAHGETRATSDEHDGEGADFVGPLVPWFKVVNTLHHPLTKLKREGTGLSTLPLEIAG